MIRLLDEDEYFRNYDYDVLVAIATLSMGIIIAFLALFPGASVSHLKNWDDCPITRFLRRLGVGKGKFTIFDLLTAIFKNNSHITPEQLTEFAKRPEVRQNSLLRVDCEIGMLRAVGLSPVAGIAGEITQVWAAERMVQPMDGSVLIGMFTMATAHYYSLVQRLRNAADSMQAMSQVVTRRGGNIPTLENGGQEEYENQLQDVTLAYERRVEENKTGFQRPLTIEFKAIWQAGGMDTKDIVRLYCRRFCLLEPSMLPPIRYLIKLLGTANASKLWLQLSAEEWILDDCYDSSGNEDEILKLGIKIVNIGSPAPTACPLVNKILKLIGCGVSMEQARRVCAGSPGVPVKDIIEKFDALVKKGVSNEQAASVCAETAAVPVKDILEKFDALVKKGVSKEQAATGCARRPGVPVKDIIEKFDASKKQAASLCAETAAVPVKDTLEKFDALVARQVTPKQATTLCAKTAAVSVKDTLEKFDALVARQVSPQQAATVCAETAAVSVKDTLEKFDALVARQVPPQQAGMVCYKTAAASVKDALEKFDALVSRQVPPEQAATLCYTFSGDSVEELMNKVDGFINHYHCPKSYAISFCAANCKLVVDELIELEKKEQQLLNCPVPGCKTLLAHRSNLAEHLIHHCEELLELPIPLPLPTTATSSLVDSETQENSIDGAYQSTNKTNEGVSVVSVAPGSKAAPKKRKRVSRQPEPNNVTTIGTVESTITVKSTAGLDVDITGTSVPKTKPKRQKTKSAANGKIPRVEVARLSRFQVRDRSIKRKADDENEIDNTEFSESTTNPKRQRTESAAKITSAAESGLELLIPLPVPTPATSSLVDS
ncbi:hypothetical protein HDU76_013563 [Blyttiomyces sp. JEL0837]|nr:hypothetical protein HDU76_013563 [Blyttiomyces sp. JEL0837]